jgi:hypothetical protein
MNRFVEAFLTGAGLNAVNTSSKTLTITEKNNMVIVPGKSHLNIDKA